MVTKTLQLIFFNTKDDLNGLAANFTIFDVSLRAAF